MSRHQLQPDLRPDEASRRRPEVTVVARSSGNSQPARRGGATRATGPTFGSASACFCPAAQSDSQHEEELLRDFAFDRVFGPGGAGQARIFQEVAQPALQAAAACMSAHISLLSCQN